MDKLYGYAGKLLRVDLTDEKVTEENLDEATARKWLGGTGIGTKYLCEEVDPDVAWSDENNRIIIATGPLGGTTIGGSGTVSVVTKGPLTNGAAASQANGFFGTFLKLYGYDGIILQGRAKRWVYLYLHDGKVDIRNASHILGKDTWETSDFVKAELGLGERRIAVASIGPAGENLVKFALISFDKGHVASHNGVGAVMGSKKIKAIAVARGKGSLPLYNRQRLSAIADELFNNVLNACPEWPGQMTYDYMTLVAIPNHIKAGDGVVPVKNYTTSEYDISPEQLLQWEGSYIRNHFSQKPNPCWACRMLHSYTINIPGGPHKGYIGEEPDYEQLAVFGPLIGNTDVSEAIFLANEVDRLGLDCNEMGWTLGMAIECYQKGLLTLEDTDGIELTWGNCTAVYRMMQDIARRQGFGDILAEGVMRAAQLIGGEAPGFAVHTMKGNTPRTHDHRNRRPMLFDTCLSQIGTDEGYALLNAADLGISIKPSMGFNFREEDMLTWNALFKGAHQFEDCLGVCRFNTRTDLRLLAEAVSAATGWDFPIEETMQIGKRIVNMLRVFNIRHGHISEMDIPSPRYGSTPADGPSQGISIMVHWYDMRSKYYEQMGWDKRTGKPLPDTLRHFALEHAIPQLWGK